MQLAAKGASAQRKSSFPPRQEPWQSRGRTASSWARACETHPQGRDGPSHFRLRLLLPGNSKCHRKGKECLASEQKQLRILSSTERMLGERIYLRGAICISAPGCQGCLLRTWERSKPIRVAPAVLKRYIRIIRTTTRTIPGKRLTEPSGWAA